jgi:hypothetical protein
MSMLILLKEGGSLGIDTIGNKPIDEDLDLLPDTGTAGQSIAFRLIMRSLSTTSTGSGSKPRAIVMGDS